MTSITNNAFHLETWNWYLKFLNSTTIKGGATNCHYMIEKTTRYKLREAMCTWYASLRRSPLWFPSPRQGSVGEHTAVVAKGKFWYLHLTTFAKFTNSKLRGERRKWRHTPSCERAKSKRVATIGAENGGESGKTTHPTQLNPRWPEPLDARMSSIHEAQWSSLATPINVA